MKYLGMVGCLAWVAALFLPLTYYPAFKQYLSYFDYEYMSGKLMAALALLVLFLWVKNQVHLAGAVVFAALWVLVKDTMVFFLPKAKIFLSTGFYLLAGVLVMELILALGAIWAKRRQNSAVE